MKLLMITRKVDKDDVQAGFVYNWVKKLGQKVVELKVICLAKGNTEGLPENVEVFSLGKEKGAGKIRKFLNFQKWAVKLISQIDGVFCHQNPEYTILIAPYAKLFGKKIVSWYGHKHISWRVRLMNFLANQVVTSSQLGFRLNSPKKKIIGQGIDTDFFVPLPHGRKSEQLKIISVGRISPIKNYETLIEAANILKKQGLSFRVQIIGSVVLASQQNYFNQLKKMVKEKQLGDEIQFLGGLPQGELLKFYQTADLAVNLCPTGAPDKAGLEAMACQAPLLACNQSYAQNFGVYTDRLLFQERNFNDLAKKIIGLTKADQGEIGSFLRKQVIEHHNLDNLLEGIIRCF